MGSSSKLGRYGDGEPAVVARNIVPNKIVTEQRLRLETFRDFES